MSDDLVKQMREALAAMAARCSVPIELWQDHSVSVLKAADRIEADAARIEARDGELRAKTQIIAELEAERDELRACIAWVDEVYPQRIEAGGAGIHITWDEFNAMQAAIGVTVDKRIGTQEGKASHNHRLRATLAAERTRADAAEARVKELQAALRWFVNYADGAPVSRSEADRALSIARAALYGENADG